MTTQDRMNTLQDFLKIQRYLAGLAYEIEFVEASDSFIITIPEIERGQFMKLQHRARVNGLDHVEIRGGKKLIETKHKHKKR